MTISDEMLNKLLVDVALKVVEADREETLKVLKSYSAAINSINERLSVVEEIIDRAITDKPRSIN